jgi:hypothetical protein
LCGEGAQSALNEAQNAEAVSNLLEKFFDLPRELRLGRTWLVLAALVAGIDAYTIARFDLALLTLLGRADELLAQQPRVATLLLESLCAVASAALFWFYVLPLLVFGWRQLVFEVRLRFPGWLGVEADVSPSKGWRRLPAARIDAIEQDNAVLMQACDRREAQARANKLVLDALIALIVLALLAFAAATPASGPSAGEALGLWVSDLSGAYQLIVGVLTIPGLALATAVLLGRGAEQDSHIRLSSPEPDPKQPPAYLRKPRT